MWIFGISCIFFNLVKKELIGIEHKKSKIGCGNSIFTFIVFPLGIFLVRINQKF